MSQGKTDERRVCPLCSALARPGATNCWLCGNAVRPDWPALAPGEVPSGLAWMARPGHADHCADPRPFQFGLSTLLLIVTLFAVLCSIWMMAPGLGAVLTVAACLGLAGLAGSSFRAGRRGVALTTGQKATAFFRPIWIAALVVFVIAVVALVGLFIMCSTMK